MLMRPRLSQYTTHETLRWPDSCLRQLTRRPSHRADKLLHDPSSRQARLQNAQPVHTASLAPVASSSAYEAPLKRQRLSPTLHESQQLYGPCTSSRSSSLHQLQAFLGYQFNSEQLLDQACTHSSDKGALSYRQLAFLGDAALWLLFAEHAYHTYGFVEDPARGAWPAHLSAILSRANCAATARQWGLQYYLQHSEQQQQKQKQQSTEPSSSSSSRSGMHQGTWSSDSLAEMFEGVIGALLLDSDYSTVRQLLQPWVAAAFAASRSTASAVQGAQGVLVLEACALPGSTCESSSSSSSSNARTQHSSVSRSTAAVAVAAMGDAAVMTSNSRWDKLYSSHQCDTEQQYSRLCNVLQQQVQTVCSYRFRDVGLLQTCSKHIVLLLSYGSSSAEDEKCHFIGYSLLQYAAAQHTYHCHCTEQLMTTDCPSPSSSSQSCSSGGALRQQQDLSSSSSTGEASSSGSSSKNLLQLMSKQMVNMTTIRHRCKMWLWLGLDPSSWCPADSYLFTVKWKVQKQLVSRCLDLLLAAVYLDGGLDAALGVVGVLLQGTPPTGMDKSWIPSWANKGAATAVGSSSSASSVSSSTGSRRSNSIKSAR